MSLLRDERGSVSSMRTLLFCVAIPVLVLMTFTEAAKWLLFPAAAWTAWSGIVSMLIIGCFGPRVAQYLGPQLGAIVNAVKDSTIAKRRQQGGDFEVTS